jgi:hypothetical protein
MTLAICFACGAIKFGALCPCEKCKTIPKSEDEIAVSLLMSDHHMSVADLESLSQAMMGGRSTPCPIRRAWRAGGTGSPTRARHHSEIKKTQQ